MPKPSGGRHPAKGLGGGLRCPKARGSKPAGYVHPLALRVMQEIGIDISSHRSKHLEEFLKAPVETVITVCGKRRSGVPHVPAGR